MHHRRVRCAYLHVPYLPLYVNVEINRLLEEAFGVTKSVGNVNASCIVLQLEPFTYRNQLGKKVGYSLLHN